MLKMWRVFCAAYYVQPIMCSLFCAAYYVQPIMCSLLSSLLNLKDHELSSYLFFFVLHLLYIQTLKTFNKHRYLQNLNN